MISWKLVVFLGLFSAFFEMWLLRSIGMLKIASLLIKDTFTALILKVHCF